MVLEKRPLGGTGIEVSCLGLGTVKIGRDQAVKYPAKFRLPDDRQVEELLGTARDLGINLIDTAPAYGISEARLGQLLSDRDHWVLCSKVGEEFQDGISSFDFSARHTRFSIERSLTRLNTDYLDLVLVHSDGNDLDIINHSDCLDELAKLKQSGLIRAYGMSTKTTGGGLLAAQRTDVVMVTCNIRDRDDIPVIQQGARLGKGILIKKGLISGHLTESDNPADPVRQNLEFIFAQRGVSSIVIGTINKSHLIDNVGKTRRVLQNS